MSKLVEDLRDHEYIDGDFGIRSLREDAARRIEKLEGALKEIDRCLYQWSRSEVRNIAREALEDSDE